MSPVLRTRLTELVGVRHPIVQTGMGYVSGARLTAATANAGGLGVIASATMSLDELRSAIREVRRRTSAPFGVNLRADATDARERVELAIAESVRVVSFALAPRRDLIARLRDAGVVTIPSVGALPHAEKVAAWGADAVIVQGGEGGGHTGAVPTSLLLPQVVDAVDIPVVAAGGFFDGRGLVAALAYGAAGIAMGTRFLLTSDSTVGASVKQAYLDSGPTDTVVTTRIDGLPHRVLRTRFVERLERSGRITAVAGALGRAVALRRITGTTWPALVRDGFAARRGRELSWAQTLLAANTPVLLRAAMVDDRADLGVMSAGQVVGLIDDLPSCAELIDRIVAEADECLARLTTAR
ncbi:nitronate monooxygenase [Micromonospora sp. WMMA1363]|uniref:NAD(P)H-dependent flavin oxidoreductase n=1 Tax=Micromonospora sp. WMMA1363 TaxID=3053985 RepID=UPI00259CF480|nr:nitronate monooxygenase [Micromonospora sp. WMMA1363]MDM4719384.1 nitronate monooxygenase [Micromonospora sp. WMMA1363]